MSITLAAIAGACGHDLIPQGKKDVDIRYKKLALSSAYGKFNKEGSKDGKAHSGNRRRN